LERNSTLLLYGQTPLSADGVSSPPKDPPDVLSKQKCLDALAALRHAKWFQVGITYYFYLPLPSLDSLCNVLKTSDVLNPDSILCKIM
jgi:hypothetical protein